MEVVKGICKMVAVNEMQFGYTSMKGTIDDVYILSRFQYKYCARGRHCICLIDLAKDFDIVQRGVLDEQCGLSSTRYFGSINVEFA